MPRTSLTKEEVDQHLNVAHALMNQAAERKGEKILASRYNRDDYYGYYTGNYYIGKLSDQWETFTNLVHKTDYTSLNRAEQASLRRILTGPVMKRATKAAYLILADKFTEAYNVIDSTMPKDQIKALQISSAKRYTKQQLTSISKNQRPVSVQPIEHAVEPPKPPPLPGFPNLAEINKDITTAVEELKAIWIAAAKMPDLNIEDRYILVETAKTYLPDAWRMYANLGTMPKNIQRQAAEMLLAQVKALIARIKKVTRGTGESALKDLRAHTASSPPRQPKPQPCSTSDSKTTCSGKSPIQLAAKTSHFPNTLTSPGDLRYT